LTAREHRYTAKTSSPDRRRPPWTEADAQRVLEEWQRSDSTLEAFARAREGWF
jgi:hypothetical protein